MIIAIDRNACIGCGVCASVCADTFAMWDDRKAHVERMPDTDHEDCARTAALDCPTRAIHLN